MYSVETPYYPYNPYKSALSLKNLEKNLSFSKSEAKCVIILPGGALAEWLRSGLQNRVHRFNSGRHLHFC